MTLAAARLLPALARVAAIVVAFLAASALIAWAIYDGIDAPLFHVRPLAWWEVGKVCVDLLLGALVVAAVLVGGAYVAGTRHRARIEAAGQRPLTVVAVNGRAVETRGLLRHADLVRLAGMTGPCIVRWRSPDGRVHTVSPHGGLCPRDGTEIDVTGVMS